MIVRAEKIQSRIEQTRLLQPQVNRIRSLRGAESARTQTLVRFAGIFVSIRQPRFQTPATTAFENAENVSRLRDFPTRQRIQERQNAFQSFQLGGWLWNLNQRLRRAAGAVALAEVRVLNRKTAIVVKRRAPKHGAVSHH